MASDGFRFRGPADAPAFFARGLIRGYQLTLSALVGRQCRHLPTCSDYAMEAIGRFGLWGGGWMGFSRICRCRPGGTAGFDPVPAQPPPGADAMHFWRYGRWRGPLACDEPGSTGA
ncbi:MAG: membrane protein insertion efficiency factor YidD [Beijerinckiaceae bacterium]